jgi:hypothetical protein
MRHGATDDDSFGGEAWEQQGNVRSRALEEGLSMGISWGNLLKMEDNGGLKLGKYSINGGF